MKDNTMKIEKRLENMKNFYLNTEEMIEKLPDAIPSKTKDFIKDKILGDQELKELIEGIDKNRPPRVFLIGRTGVGKSSLINAICGAYVAQVSDVESCTSKTKKYTCKDGERPLIEILDTRGIAESESLNSNLSAEEELLKEIKEFSPDVAIMMLNCTHRDDIVTDVNFLKKVADEYMAVNEIRLPIVVVVNKCDQMAPAKQVDPATYSKRKLDKIQEVVDYYKDIIVKNGLVIDDILPVSSLIDWANLEGEELDVDEINSMSLNDIAKLQISFDGRFGIEELFEVLQEAIQDCEAKMGLRMAARLTDVVERFSKHIVAIFSGISATVALTPIPTSDIYILLIIQSLMVTMIASLSGRDISLDTAREFIFSLSGIGILGYGFKILAQQATKLLNALFVGAGSVISSSVAYGGTFAIGKAAIDYYIYDKTLEEAKEKVNTEKDKHFKK